jgi:Protein of unknown function (DUF1173)
MPKPAAPARPIRTGNRQDHVLICGKTFLAKSVREDPSRFQIDLHQARELYGHALCCCGGLNNGSLLKLVIKQVERKLILAAWPNSVHLHRSTCIFSQPNTIAVGHDAHVHDIAVESCTNRHESVHHHAIVQRWMAHGLNQHQAGNERTINGVIKALRKSVIEDGLSSIVYCPPLWSKHTDSDHRRSWWEFLGHAQRTERAQTCAIPSVIGVIRKASKSKDHRLLSVCFKHFAPGFDVSLNTPDLERIEHWLPTADSQSSDHHVVAQLWFEDSQGEPFKALKASFLVIDSHGMPIKSQAELELAKSLRSQGRSFRRPVSAMGLHDNNEAPSFVLLDCVKPELAQHSSVPLFIRRRNQGATSDEPNAMKQDWVWSVDRTDIPALPPIFQPTPTREPHV